MKNAFSLSDEGRIVRIRARTLPAPNTFESEAKALRTDEADDMELKFSRQTRRQDNQLLHSSATERAGEEEEGAVLDAYSRFLWAAVVKGNLAAVRGVYKEKRVLYVDHHGNTALHLAAKMGQLNILK